MTKSVGYASEIRPLFRQVDIDHMAPFGVQLDQYEWLSDASGGSIGDCSQFDDHANGRSVHAFLTGECMPRMPLGGPFWTQDLLDLYQRWMDDGFQP